MSKYTILASYWKGSKKIDVTVKDYETLLKNKNKTKAKAAISTMIYHRFYDRYMKPFNYTSKKYKKFYKNGFAMMANACLLIEALEAFYQGWEDTRNRGEDAFKKFFLRVKCLAPFKKDASNFYKHIRCGILHQAETTGGYKILRIGSLFDDKNRVINATKFLEELKMCLGNYTDELKTSEWDSEIWDNFRRKMRSIIKNCEKK